MKPKVMEKKKEKIMKPKAKQITAAQLVDYLYKKHEDSLNEQIKEIIKDFKSSPFGKSTIKSTADIDTVFYKFTNANYSPAKCFLINRIFNKYIKTKIINLVA
jgi:RecJ-like exonuclease